MLRRPPRSTRTDTLFPYTTLFRSLQSIASFTAEQENGARERIELEDIAHLRGQSIKALAHVARRQRQIDLRRRRQRQAQRSSSPITSSANLNASLSTSPSIDTVKPPLRRISIRPGSDGVVSGSAGRSEEHTSELKSLMRISYAVLCLKK